MFWSKQTLQFDEKIQLKNLTIFSVKIRWSKPSKQTSQFDRKIQVFEIDYFSRENSKNSLEIKINVAI